MTILSCSVFDMDGSEEKDPCIFCGWGSFAIDNDPAWSPDGKWIAWNTDDGVWLMKQDGREQHLLTQDGSMPAWSPDSQKIIFSKPTANQEKVVLWVVNLEDSGLKQITF